MNSNNSPQRLVSRYLTSTYLIDTIRVMGERFVTCELEEILVGEPLPVDIFIYINFRFITYKLAGDNIDREAYERFEFKKVRNLFMHEKDQPAFEEWAHRNQENLAPSVAPPVGLTQARENAYHKTRDLFSSSHPDKVIEQTLATSRGLVTEVMKFPFAVHSISQLQLYSQGTVDHSINVSVLSVYLAMQMGYSHNLILQHVGSGALVHDIGKTQIKLEDGDNAEVMKKKLELHPELGLKLLESQTKVPHEVKMIVAQHHEQYNGQGYPKKLRGNAIYDLSRIVSIANVFDELVSDGKGTLAERQRAAVREMDEVRFKEFDPQKLEKALKILKLGL